MPGGSPRRGEPRPLIYRRLELAPELAEEAERLARDAVSWALRLLREDETKLLADGRAEDIAFGRWLTLEQPGGRSVYELVAEALPLVIAALTAMRLNARDLLRSELAEDSAPNSQQPAPDSQDSAPHTQFTNVSSIARAAGVARTAVFAEWSPRALLLPELAHAYLIAIENEPPLSSLAFCSDMRLGGPEATAAGLHRVNKTTTVSGLASLCGIGRDVAMPYSSVPYTVGYPPVSCSRDDLDQLQRFGLTAWPTSHAEHFDLPLRIASEAKAVVQRARARSRVFGSIKLDPATMLASAFPPWLTVGALPVGVIDKPKLLPRRREMPGGNAELLRLTISHGLRPIFELFDTGEPAASEQALQNVVVVAGGLYSGQQFMAAVCSAQRLHPDSGLRQEPAATLREVGRRAELRALGIDIDPTQVQWLWLRSGLRIAENGVGMGLSLGLVVRATDVRTVAYVVDADLASDEVRASIIARTELHYLQANGDPAHGDCVSRVYGDYDLHRLKPRGYDTRSWLRGAILLSNPAVVAVGRRHQARRPA